MIQAFLASVRSTSFSLLALSGPAPSHTHRAECAQTLHPRVNLWRRTVNSWRAEWARNEGATRLDDTRYTTSTFKRRINYRTAAQAPSFSLLLLSRPAPSHTHRTECGHTLRPRVNLHRTYDVGP